MAFKPPLATAAEAAELGMGAITAPSLLKASIRVRTYLTGRVTDELLLEPNDGLTEVVCSIAARLQSLDPGLADGVQSEGSDGVSVTFGWDAWQGISSLVKGEKDALDNLFPRLPFTVALGV